MQLKLAEYKLLTPEQYREERCKERGVPYIKQPKSFLRDIEKEEAKKIIGKFERFLELGSDDDDKFAFAGSSIILDAGSCSCGCCKGPQHFKKDEKDPLDRFNGLFDGITYGGGRFVLVEGLGIKDRHDKEIYIDDILAQEDKYANLTQDLFLVRGNRTHNTGYEGGNFYGINLYCHTTSAIFDSEDIDLRSQILGNLHQNPELYEKTK